MRNLLTGLFVLSTIGLMQCSDKTEDAPKPFDAASAVNYAEVDGKSFAADSSLTLADLLPYKPGEVHTDKKTTYLVIYLYTKSKGQSIEFGIYDFKMKTGRIDYPINAPNQRFDYTGITYRSSSPTVNNFSTVGSISPDWSIDITEFDQIRQRVKGTFSGTVGTGANAVRIAKGRFNVAYRVR